MRVPPTESCNSHSYMTRRSIHTDQERDIPSGRDQSARFPIPADATWCELTLNRDQWAPGGVLLTVLFSYVGDVNEFVEVRRETLDAGEVNLRTGVIPPAVIGTGWRDPQPRFAIIRTDAPTQFRASTSFDVGDGVTDLTANGDSQIGKVTRGIQD